MTDLPLPGEPPATVESNPFARNVEALERDRFPYVLPLAKSSSTIYVRPSTFEGGRLQALINKH